MGEFLRAEQWETYREGTSRGDCRISYGDSTRRWAESKGLVVRWKKTFSVVYGIKGAMGGATALPMIVAGPLYLWQGDFGKLASYLWHVGVLPIFGVVALGGCLGLGFGVLLGRTQAFKRSFSLLLGESEEIYKAALIEGDIEIWYERGSGAGYDL